MINHSASLIGKVILLSAAISVVIKFFGPKLPIPATSAVALSIVLLPLTVVAGLLAWRAWQYQQQS